MKKFLKIVLFGILTLSLINISDTKINYLNNNEVEKVKSPRKNANGDMSKIQNLSDLSFTEWHQSGNTGKDNASTNYLYSISNTQIKVLDIINYDNRNEIKEVYTNFPSSDGYYLPSFGYELDNNLSNKPLIDFYACQKGSNIKRGIGFFDNNIIKFYDMSTFINGVNQEYYVKLFLDALKSSFTLYVPDTPQEAFIQVNDNITTNREELDKNFKHISIKGLSDTFKLNEKIDISSILNNQNIKELEITFVYNDLPTIIYNQFNIRYPMMNDDTKKYTLSGMQQKQWGNLSRTIKFTINNRSLDASTLEINLINYQHTINALSGKSFILNTNINLPKEIQGSTDYIDIKPAFAYTDVIQPGFYISYVYNQGKVLNEYMDVYSTNYYKYVMQINKTISTNGDLGILLYDNDNSPKASGTPLYNFTQNGFIATYGIPPRIITFTKQFNTNNLISMKLTSEGEGSSFIFDAYDWLLSNGELYQINDYETAYQIGYSEGMHFSTSSTNWIKSVFNAVDSVLQIEILPNFKLWYIVAIPLLFGCVLFVFKILR
ncbi:MAG: hypothetical protein SPI06_08405 [Terrisporobacter sp.]|uniref:hypothetical protein n=1 Tax=Terrisporobacter sp. TaxID=1965305 RepID=UPI002A914CBE|nr:hypothetical protein [Terrisporobacter sp.]MDY6153420.1 hypothetical protein [Terrisporobacter sp.]